MIATTAIVLAAVGLTHASPVHASSEARASVEYKTYRGDGTVDQGWPAVSDWADFDTMYVIHPPILPSIHSLPLLPSWLYSVLKY